MEVERAATSPAGRTADAIAAGVGMVHQHFMLVPTLTVAENVVLGRELTTRAARSIARRAERDGARAERARPGSRCTPARLVADLSVGEAQRVEILKTLYRGAKILDPRRADGGALAAGGARAVGGAARAARRAASTIVLITHKLDEVMEISDTITVMRAGRDGRRGCATAGDDAADDRAGDGRSRRRARARHAAT